MNPQAVIHQLEGKGKTVPALVKDAEFVQCVECTEDDYHPTVSRFVEDRTPVVVKSLFRARVESPERLDECKQDDLSWKQVIDPAQFERFLVHERPVRPRLWNRREDGVTLAHFDNLDNMVFMLSQIKMFVVYPPSEHRNLYHRTGMLGAYRKTWADLEQPDLARFPKLERLGRPRLAVLEAGDAFFLPSNFTHQVYSYTATGDPILAVNFWLQTPWRLLWKNEGPLLEKAYVLAFPFILRTFGASNILLFERARSRLLRALGTSSGN